jgi:hypothetical protein
MMALKGKETQEGAGSQNSSSAWSNPVVGQSPRKDNRFRTGACSGGEGLEDVKTSVGSV